MKLPKGYTEEQVVRQMKNAVGHLAKHFIFGYYDLDDIKQEGYLYAIDAVEKYDVDNSRGCSLYTYIYTYVKNRLLNLRRDKMERLESPCDGCKDAADGQCRVFGQEELCPIWAAWRRRNDTKKNLASMHEDESTQKLIDYEQKDISNELADREISTYVLNHIPISFRSNFLRYLDGYKLSKPKREQLQKIVLDILENHPDYPDILD